MECAESLRVQAYFDGELDAIMAAQIEQHIGQCADCHTLLKDLERTSAALRRDLTYEHTPPELRARIGRALDQETAPNGQPVKRRDRSAWRPQPFWLGLLGGVGGSVAAGYLAFLLLIPAVNNPLLDSVVSAHLRSLMPSHLIDVASTDQHTVKPWFAGHSDVSPVVADFTEQGYRLVGGRTDYLHHERSAAVVYQHGPHVINVFSWSADRSVFLQNTTRGGYHMAFWTMGDLQYCAVSDTGWSELLGLVHLLRDLGAHEVQR